MSGSLRLFSNGSTNFGSFWSANSRAADSSPWQILEKTKPRARRVGPRPLQRSHVRRHCLALESGRPRRAGHQSSQNVDHRLPNFQCRILCGVNQRFHGRAPIFTNAVLPPSGGYRLDCLPAIRPTMAPRGHPNLSQRIGRAASVLRIQLNSLAVIAYRLLKILPADSRPAAIRVGHCKTPDSTQWPY